MLFFLMICSQKIFFLIKKKKASIAWDKDCHSRCDLVCRATRCPGQDADVAGLRMASHGPQAPRDEAWRAPYSCHWGFGAPSSLDLPQDWDTGLEPLLPTRSLPLSPKRKLCGGTLFHINGITHLLADFSRPPFSQHLTWVFQKSFIFSFQTHAIFICSSRDQLKTPRFENQ